MEPLTKGPFDPYWTCSGGRCCEPKLILIDYSKGDNKMEPGDDPPVELGPKVIDSGYKESDKIPAWQAFLGLILGILVGLVIGISL